MHISKLAPRQRLRFGLSLVWILSFPITLYYFSPYLPFAGLSEGVISGSLILFALLGLTSIFVGRLFCGWLCPAGAIQHVSALVNPRPVNQKKLHLLKYILVWFPFVGGLVAMFLNSKGPFRLDFTYQTQFGISVAEPGAYIIYGSVVLLFLGLSLIFGRRASCHSMCWISPFMVIPMQLAKLARIPRVVLKTQPSSCISCGLCTKACPMSLQVEELVKREKIAHYDCILCGQCADSCPKKVIRFGIGSATPSKTSKAS